MAVRWQGVVIALLLALVAFVVQNVCSYWNNGESGSLDFDQTIFYLIGRAWYEGHLPYVDVWDSKGPLVFLFNGMGQVFHTGPKGVLWVQILNFACVLWTAWLCLRRRCGRVQTAVCVSLFIAAYVIVCSCGNQVGDYTLALSVACVSCTYWWSLRLERGQVEHPARYAFLYGVFFAGCLLSRLTNAMVLVASVGVIGVMLAWHRRWGNLVCNVCAFLVGFVCCMAPFAVYFVWHGAWGEMWYAMFWYNIEYALHSSPLPVDSQCGWAYLVFYFIALLSVPVYAVAVWPDGKRRVVAIFWCVVTVPVALWLINSYANANYAISYLPVLLVSLQQLVPRHCAQAVRDGHGDTCDERNINVKADARRGKRRRWRSRCALTAIVLITCVGCVNQLRLYRIWNGQSDESKEAQNRLALSIPHSDTMVAYNCSPGVYVAIGKLPHCRFFVCQDWAIQNGASLRAKVREAYEHTDAPWIMVEDMEHCAIRDILHRRYRVVKADRAHHLVLMRLKR